MSEHLFGSVTLPPELGQLVDFHRLHVDRGAGFASLLDGWRAFLRYQLDVGPMAFLSSGLEHLEHFGDETPDAIGELIRSPWSEVVSLGVAIQSIQFSANQVIHDVRSDLPMWLSGIEQRTVVRASVRDESPHGGPMPWIVELDFGYDTTGSANVWINQDGSLYQLYPSDDSIDELEAFLGEINHLVPNRPFVRVPPADALGALRQPAEHAATSRGDKAMLQWLLRTPAFSPPITSLK